MSRVPGANTQGRTLVGTILLPIQMVVVIVLVAAIIIFQGITWENNEKRKN